jgi:hypothetical protein
VTIPMRDLATLRPGNDCEVKSQPRRFRGFVGVCQGPD